ncbi:MAG: hypothetical protein FJZ56_05525, partial [Chlamydiae bacterium]|nr:hypothetical protein [Chlamydiota bacterium]
PMKASYILASRQAPQDIKEELIHKYDGEKQKELIDKIQVHLPINKEDKRRQESVEKKLLLEISQKVALLEQTDIDPKYRHMLESLSSRLSSLVKTLK